MPGTARDTAVNMPSEKCHLTGERWIKKPVPLSNDATENQKRRLRRSSQQVAEPGREAKSRHLRGEWAEPHPVGLAG